MPGANKPKDLQWQPPLSARTDGKGLLGALANRREHRHTGPPDPKNENPHAVGAAQGQSDFKSVTPTDYAAEQHAARVKRAKHAEVTRRYAWQARQARKSGQYAPAQRASLITLIRLREVERLCRSRYGRFLPDDDDGRDSLELVAHHIAHLGGKVEAHIIAWAQAWAPWIPDPEAKALAAKVMAKPAKFTADRLAWRLGLKAAERAALKITTIGAVDLSKAERLALRKEKRRAADRARWARKRSGKPRGRPKLNLRPAGTLASIAGRRINPPRSRPLPPPQSGLQDEVPAHSVSRSAPGPKGPVRWNGKQRSCATAAHGSLPPNLESEASTGPCEAWHGC